MTSPKIFKSQKFSIRFETWGDPKHTPVLFFHGFPGSHIQALGLAHLVEAQKIFLIAADRPGYGETTGRGSAFDYVDDLFAMLKHLNVPKINLLGISGGAPWSHLMASRFSDQVRSHTVVCGLGTFNRDTKNYFSPVQRKGLMMGRWLPTPAAKWVVNRELGGFDPEKGLENYFKMLDSSDQNIFADKSKRSLLLTSMAEAWKQGAKGFVFDAQLYHQDWLNRHCDQTKLRAVATNYYHGRRDKLLDHRMSEWMHQQHGKSTLTLFEDEGHYSLPFQRATEILSRISA